MAKNSDKIIKNRDDDQRQQRKGFGWAKRLLLSLLAVGAGYLLYLQFGSPVMIVDKRPAKVESPDRLKIAVHELLQQGEYDQAWQDIDRYHLAELSAELQDPLSVSFYFKYDLPAAAQVQNDRLQLPINTPYYAILNPEESCYLYLLQRNTVGNWRLLFPNQRFADAENPISSGELNMPTYGRFLNETGPGTETLFLLATRWRQEKLEKMIQEVTSAAGREQRLLDYIDKNFKSKLVYPGIVCKQYAFDHQ